MEATGSLTVAEKAPELAGRLGEVILLGSPRKQHTSDLTALLRTIHLWNHGCITFKGSHEWRCPVNRDTSGHAKHSIGRNLEILLRPIAQGRLRVKEEFPGCHYVPACRYRWSQPARYT